MQVLLVEDDDTIADPLIEGLGRYGFAVSRVITGAAALDAPPCDLLLLDLGLPDMDGIDVCRQLRRTSRVPIVMLTARGSETDRVLGLEMGADDYLAKPFSVRGPGDGVRAAQPPLPAIGAGVGLVTPTAMSRATRVQTKLWSRVGGPRASVACRAASDKDGRRQQSGHRRPFSPWWR